MTTDISIYQAFPTESELKNLQMIAQAAFKSGLYKGNAEGIIMTLLAARELNIGPMLALNGGIFSINGKTELSSRLMTALIRRAGHSISIKGDDKSCTIKGKRKDNDDVAECTFTLEDAAKAGLLSNPSWKKYPEDMLFARALSRLSRRLFPDVIGNCYVEGEIDTRKEVNPDLDKLPQAESVEIKEVASEPEKPTEPIKLVDAIQALSLAETRLQLIESDRIAIDEWAKNVHGAQSMDALPEIAFEKCLFAMKNKVKSYENG